MDLYHSEIRLPDGFVAPKGRVALRYTSHARHACDTDRYGRIRMLKGMTLDRFAIIEVGVESGRVVKIVYRGRYDEQHDIVIVVIPSKTAPWTVKTVWLNEAGDSHQTLDRSRYVN